MTIEGMISDYENELASLKIALKLTSKEDIERRMIISEEITEIEEILCDLKEQQQLKKLNEIQK